MEQANRRASLIARHLTAATGAAGKGRRQKDADHTPEGMYRACVLGAGAQGPAVAFYFLQDRACAGVRLCDVSSERLSAASETLGGPTSRLRLVCADVATQAGAKRAASGCAVVVSALPLFASSRMAAIPAAAQLEGVLAVVDLALSTGDDVRALRSSLLPGTSAFVVAGCGISPGLTEVQARWAVERFSRVDALHLRIGAVPAKPSGPLAGHKVPQGANLPIEELSTPSTAPAGGPSAIVVKDGQVVPAAIYSGVEHEEVPDVGEVEAYTDFFMPWLLQLPQLRGLAVGTQKTYRWPGFAAKATALQRLGLASEDPLPGAGMVRGCVRDVVQRIVVRAGATLPLPYADATLLSSLDLDDGETDILSLLPRQDLARASPKTLLDAVAKRSGKCVLKPGETDIMLAAVTVEGELESAKGKKARVVCRLVDRGQPPFGAAVRTSAFTAAEVARMAALGQIRERPFSVVHPEEVIFGVMREQLLANLANYGITWTYDEKILP